MKARIFYTKFWTDSYVLSLSFKEKILFFFLFANDKVGLTSVYEISADLIGFSTKLSVNELEKIKEKFEKDKKMIFYKDWVFLVNASKYQKFTGKKNEIAKKRELSFVPLEVKKYFKKYPIDRVSIGYSKSGIPLIINNKKSVTNNKKPIIRKYGKIENLKEKDLEEIAVKYKVPIGFVKLTLEKMTNWCEAKGKKYKNYRRALMNWVLKSAEDKIERRQSDRHRAVDARNIGRG